MVLPFVPRLLRGSRKKKQRGLDALDVKRDVEAPYERLKALDELKSKFFANVVHELRTPLSLIVGPAERLLAAADLPEEQHADLEVIARNAHLLLKHVGDLLDLSKLDAGKLIVSYQDVDVARMVRFTASHFETLARDRGITFEISTPPSLQAEVDAEMVERIVLNLLSNALKITPENGTIRISLDRKNARATLTVEDTGPGVPPDLRDVIFDRFRLGDLPSAWGFPGVGLGLSIVKEIVALHGGSIRVGDAELGGAAFTIELPLKAPAGAEIQPRVEPPRERARAADDRVAALVERGSAHPRRDLRLREPHRLGLLPAPSVERTPIVLVIEDNVDMNRFIASALKRDHAIVSAFDGREGVDKAVALKPDLIIADLILPNLGGQKAIEEMRAHRELDGTPLLIVSARTDEELRARLLREGAQDFLSKPFSIDELRARATNLVRMKRARDLLQREIASRSQDLEKLAREAVSRKRELQAALHLARLARAEAEASSHAKDQFLSLISHELRTPLNAILGWVRLIRSGGVEGKQAEHGLEIIERHARTQTQLINNLLDLSSIMAGKLTIAPRPIDPAPIVQAAVESYRPGAEEKEIRVETSIEPSAAPINGDPERLGQVMSHLLSNALKFTPPRGRIEVSLNRTGGHARIVVRDTGEGIRPDVLPRIFERFMQADSSTTRRHGGLGMGLAIARHLVEMHGGTIQAESPGEGRGSTFTVALPLALASRSTEAEPRPSLGDGDSKAPETLERLQVLLVDDDPDTLELCRTVLEIHGARVTSASSAREALAAFAEERPDVLVSDIGMPEEDGYSLMRQIRKTEAGRDLPAVALTAYAGEEHRKRALAAGYRLHVPKPVSPDDLVRAVRAAAEGSKAAA